MLHFPKKNTSLFTLNTSIFYLKGQGGQLHIYKHYTFDLSRFKKDFVIINQKARQQATSSVERNFHKILNNSKFRIDCRNNIDNCVLEPQNELGEISYIKKFTIIFNNYS